ncbi:hypothetical protein SFC65_19845 [Priestia filamentosa]|uniref:hypothetical protein n=1 Tax=Priestia filamentosa TaxID=1402861 RepID=UPI003981F07B
MSHTNQSPLERNKKDRDKAIANLKRNRVKDTLRMTGELARIDATIAYTYIVYNKNGKMVKEFPDGRIEYFEGEIDE